MIGHPIDMPDTPLPALETAPAFNRLDRGDLLISPLLALAVFLWLFSELLMPGVTWDEGAPNFPAAKSQAKWIRNLFTLDAPFSKETIDKYWYTRSDHPSPPRTVAAISYLLFSPYVDEIVALRIPSAVKFSLLLASIYLFLRLVLPRAPALAGALSLALMPRVFGHAHIFSLDVPIMCWWFWAAAAGFLVLHGKLRPFWFGLAYALAFSTKLHAVFLPFPLLAWVMSMIWIFHRGEREYWQRAFRAAAWACLLTPILYIGLQPWLWHDTGNRIVERFFDYASKTPIPLYYLGTVYHQRTPWHYPLVMLLFTLPFFILVLGIVGLARPFFWKWNREPVPAGAWWSGPGGAYLFLLLHFATPLAIILLPLAKAYDGCRLFLPCFPFAACLVGFGYHAAVRPLEGKLKSWILHGLLFAALIVPSAASYARIRPYYLAYFNEIAGGIPGAWKWGMETTYWCDALTREFLDTINQIVPGGKTIKPSSMSFEVVQYYIDRGWLRATISDPADYYLLQCRQGMFSRAEQFLYYRCRPLATVEIGGVPLIALYEAPK